MENSSRRTLEWYANEKVAQYQCKCNWKSKCDLNSVNKKRQHLLLVPSSAVIVIVVVGLGLRPRVSGVNFVNRGAPSLGGFSRNQKRKFADKVWRTLFTSLKGSLHYWNISSYSTLRKIRRKIQHLSRVVKKNLYQNCVNIWPRLGSKSKVPLPTSNSTLHWLSLVSYLYPSRSSHRRE